MEQPEIKQTHRITAGRQVRIAVSGKSGCGNTTVSTLLAESLGIRLINFTFRTLAQEMGVSLADVIERAKRDDSFDRIVDTRQVELARASSCVLGSRLAVWMLSDADLKVYLHASDDVRARRIQQREGGDIEEISAFTRMRDAEDTKRYKRLYNIDNTDCGFVDLQIDTAQYRPQQIVRIILDELVRRSLAVPFAGGELSAAAHC